MQIEEFLALLLFISILVSLTVEALKKFTDSANKLPSNLLTGIVSIVMSLIVGICYCILSNIAFNAQVIIYLIALVFLSWLCAMLGYDKVVQSIEQIKK